MENKLQWEFGIPLKNVGSIDAFEDKVGFRFPQSFRELVIANNAGYPNKDVFDTDNEEGRTFHSLLSFNREDKDNIFDYYDWSTEDFEELGWQYIEFASSCFGDPIAFDPRTGHIIFVDHETLNTELIAETFDEFLENLYDYDEREAILRDSPAIFSVPLPTQPVQDPTGQNAEKKPGFRFPFFGKRDK